MPISLPYIPESITVHLGAPDSPAANVTVPFIDYIKNVVSSEIYPTWDQAAISANTYAIVSYALNRVYTEFYRSRGYNFDITSSTAIDQKYTQGRNIFENISRVVDRMFDDYIRRQGFVEPLAAKFCNGTTATCNGLSQWGSQELAQSGLNSLSILRNYYGNNIEIVNNAPIREARESYPGSPVRRGDTGSSVRFIQTELNRISQNYPAISKVNVDGVFGESTENAVKRFQEVFSLTPNGIVDRATWFRIVQLYVAVLQLSELQSQGLSYEGISWEYPDAIELGDRGNKVSHLQFMLAVLGSFIQEIPPLLINGIFDTATLEAVRGFQRYSGLRITGVVGAETWDTIYSQFSGIEQTVFNDAELYPFSVVNTPAQNMRLLQERLSPPASAAPSPVKPRQSMNNSRNMPFMTNKNNCINQVQKHNSASQDELLYQYSSRFRQFPYRELYKGMKDGEGSV